MILPCEAPGCEGQIDIGDPDWDRVGEKVSCPRCERVYEIQGEETYNEETNEDHDWWYLEQDDTPPCSCVDGHAPSADCARHGASAVAMAARRTAKMNLGAEKPFEKPVKPEHRDIEADLQYLANHRERWELRNATRGCWHIVVRSALRTGPHAQPTDVIAEIVEGDSLLEVLELAADWFRRNG